MDQTEVWAKCSTCKKEIALGAKYYVCSVSTCRHKRKGFRFCSVPCWDAHLGFMNHREAYAEEAVAPRVKEELKEELEKETKIMTEAAEPITPLNDDQVSCGSKYDQQAADITSEVLVVVSKVKKFIKEQSGMNTSQCCVDALTKKVVAECLKGAESARQAGRKTVMGRDIL